jgi:type II secretory pathway component HofQ
VKMQIFCIHFALVLVLGASPLSSQKGLDQTPGQIEIAKHPLVLEPPQRPQARKVDLAKLHQEARDLAQLAQSIPPDVDQAAQGKLPKDLAEKLKQIEKISKHLRGELVP